MLNPEYLLFRVDSIVKKIRRTHRIKIGSSVANMTFDKSHRLLNASDYKAVFDNAPFRASHHNLLILSRLNEFSNPRLGLVIAKKHIRLAVQRNRIKRILRETFRLRQHDLKNIDIVVLAKKGLDDLDNQQLHNLFDKQWSRIIKKIANLSVEQQKAAS